MKAFKFVPVRKLAALAAAVLGTSLAGTSVASAGASVVDFTSSTNIRGLGNFSGSATLDNSTDLLTVVATFRGFKNGKRDHAGAAVVIPTTPADINSDVPSGMGGIVLPLAIRPAGPTGSTSTGGTSTGGAIDLPGSGGGQTALAIPLPSAAVSGMTMLALLAAVAAKRKLAGIL